MIRDFHNSDESAKMRRIESALKAASRNLRERSIREGRKLIVWRNNRVEHVDPAELLVDSDAAQAESTDSVD